MSVRIDGDIIHLEGRCLAEDADTLLVALQACPNIQVDLSAVQRLHLGVMQVLLVAKPRIASVPAEGFVARHLVDLFL